MSSMWTGLVRRFSTEETLPSDNSSNNHSYLSHKDGAHLASDSTAQDGISDVFNPVRRTLSPFRPPPLDPIVLHGYRSDTQRLLSNTVAEEIRTMVPERLRLMEDWRLIYSLEQDGASLTTLYQKCRAFEGQRVGFVLVVKDQEGGTFGAYLSEFPHPAPSYFGNGECFLWRASTLLSLPPPPSADTTNLTRNTTLAAPRVSASSSSKRDSKMSNNTPLPIPDLLGGGSGGGDEAPADSTGASTPEMIRFKAFPYSGLNDFYMHCETGFLSVGSGGGHYGLWLDDGLDVGHSAQCDTFGNEPLSDEGQKFGVLGVELWVMGK